MNVRVVFPGMVLACLCLAAAGFGQDQGKQDDDVREILRKMNERIEKLERMHEDDQGKIKELETRLKQVEGGPSDKERQAQVDALKEEVKLEVTADLAEPPKRSVYDLTSGAEGSGNLLNPQITAFLDLGGSVSSRGRNKALNRFNLREVELDFRAAISPSVDGVMILSLGEDIQSRRNGDVTIDQGVDVEESYLDVHTLPHNLALKIGKFRNAFGRNNQLHTHDLPQVTRPLAIQSFFGPEGLSTVGASLSWLVPNPWDKYLEATVQVVNADGGADSPILGGPNADNPAVVAHVKFFDDLTETSSLEIGASYLYTHTSSRSHFDANVFGLDVAYQWDDPDPGKFRSLLLQGEAYWSDNDVERGWFGPQRNDTFGTYAFAQYQFDQNWYVGLRGDYTEYPNSAVRRPGEGDVAVSPYVTWYLTEFLRTRLQYEHRWIDTTRGAGDEDAVFLQFTGVIGSHPPHPYWVRH